MTASSFLKMCLSEDTGLRRAERAHEMDLGLPLLSRQGWQVATVAPGLYRVSRNNGTITVEMKMPDAQGNAHCLAFGPGLLPGDAGRAADRFNQNGHLGALVATPTQGYDRRYTAQGLPFQLDLVAYKAQGFGDVVGLVMSGIQPDTRSRELSPSGAQLQSVQNAISAAIRVCINALGNAEAQRVGMTSAGLQYERAADAQGRLHTYFTPDNAVKVTSGPGTCVIETRQMPVSFAVQTTFAAAHATRPGQFDMKTENRTGCRYVLARPGTGMPISFQVRNIAGQGNGACADDGTSRITLVVAG